MSVYTGYCVKYYAPGDVRIESAPEIMDINEDEALIKIEACAICGTDMKSFTVGNPRIIPPQTMGHEFCGTIIKTGRLVEQYYAGQRVTMATTIGCGKCVYCMRSKTNLCREAKAIGFHFPGAMATYLVVPADAIRQNHLVDVGDLDPLIATLSEPLSCTVNNLTRMTDTFERILILGLGPLGFLHAVSAKGLGIPEIVCVDFPGKRFDLAIQMGFKAVLTPDGIDVRYLELSGGEGFDLVVITAPSNSMQSLAVKYARKGGYVSYFASLPAGNEMLAMNSRTIHYNELTLYGTSDSTVAHVRKAVCLLQQDPEGFRTLISHVLPFSEFHRAIDEIKSGNAIKVVLIP